MSPCLRRALRSSSTFSGNREDRLKKKPLKRTTKAKTNEKEEAAYDLSGDFLPRTRELKLTNATNHNVFGIDEAGRGPLAGPVVAAAALVPHNIPGVIDSKKLSKEEKREELYQQIVSSPNVKWAAAVVDAGRIDEINILQATMEAMRMAASALIHTPNEIMEEASANMKGCYVVCGRTDTNGICIAKSMHDDSSSSWYALVDGNRIPNDMPCEAEAIVKGDSKEYSIAAASIIAKVTRDRLMRQYDSMYSEYDLQQHKGYPTAKHMAAVRIHGASPIHRRTFAPLKHMKFDKNGKIVSED